MMEITCESCGKNYRIDETKLKKPVTKLKCKACDGVITVRKPGDSDEGIPDTAPAATPTPAPAPAASPEPAPAAAAPPPAAPRKKVRFGLVWKVSLIMLIVSLVPFGVFVGLTFKETRDRIARDTEALMAETATGLGRQVDEWVDKNVRVLNAAAKMPGIQSMNPMTQEPILKAIGEAYPYIYLAFTVDPQGMNISRSDGKSLRDYSDRQYYKTVAGGKDLSWQTLIGKTSKKPALVLAVPVKRNGQLVGVIAAAMTSGDISKTVAAWRKGNTGFAFLVDETGKVVAHQRRQFVLTQKNLSTHPLIRQFRQTKRTQAVSFTDATGQEMQGFVRGNKFGWALAIQQADEEVFAERRRAEAFAMYLLIGTVVLVLLIAWLSARTIVRPINELTDVAERMSMGELDMEIKIKSKDEIGQLAQAVGRMQTSLSMAIERLRRRR
jgi:methyl-accepting chemotaxis protein